MATKAAKAPPKSAKINPQQRTVSVLEYFAPDAKDRIDREHGIIRGVKLLGRVSKNGHRYSDKALRDAAKLYEGVTVNRNHPPNRNATAERLVEEPFGVIRDPVAKITGDDETDGVFGDHHYPLKDPWTETYLEKVERFPTTLGFSHNAVVTESVQDGKVIFDSVERARSVDLVANPATTRGIFESEGSMNPDDPNYVAPTMEATPDSGKVPEEATTEETLDQALKMAVCAILDDEELDVDQKRDKIVKLLTAHEEVTREDEEKGNGEKKPEEESPADDKKDDTASLRDRLTKLEQELKAKNTLESAREALEKAGFRPSKVEVKAFSVLESTAERDEFIATLKKANAQPPTVSAERAKPRSTSIQSLESAKAADSVKAGASSIKSHDDLKRFTAELFCG